MLVNVRPLHRLLVHWSIGLQLFTLFSRQLNVPGFILVSLQDHLAIALKPFSAHVVRIKARGGTLVGLASSRHR
jgi:hypothetical protein